MKSLWAIGVAFCFLPFHANAIDITFDNTTADATDVTVDWSDGTMWGWDYSAAPEGWRFLVDRQSYPYSFLNFYFPGDLYFGLFWQDPAPTTHTLDHYYIYAPDQMRVIAQESTAITFRLDRNGVAVPEADTGTIFALMLAGLISLGLIRHKLLKRPCGNRC